MKHSRARLFLGCFLRSYFVLAAYNPQGLQNIGFLYAIEPALVRLHGSGEGLQRARLRYARHYNCHPFFTPMMLGVLLHMETGIAEGRLDPAVLENLKDTTANALSAIGDSLFTGTLLATWSLIMCSLVLAGMPLLALWATVGLFFLLQGFKLLTFILGLRKGMALLFLLRRFDLMNKVDWLKGVNAFLLVLFLWLALPGSGPPAWACVGVYLFLASWLVGKVHIPRLFVALALLAFTVALHLSGWFGMIPAFLASSY